MIQVEHIIEHPYSLLYGSGMCIGFMTVPGRFMRGHELHRHLNDTIRAIGMTCVCGVGDVVMVMVVNCHDHHHHQHRHGNGLL